MDKNDKIMLVFNIISILLIGFYIFKAIPTGKWIFWYIIPIFGFINIIVNTELIYLNLLNTHKKGNFYVVSEKGNAFGLSLVILFCEFMLGILVYGIMSVFTKIIIPLLVILGVGLGITGFILLYLNINKNIAIKKLGKKRVK